MSIKKYFDNVSNVKALSGKTSQDIGGQIESAGFHEQDIINEERYIPHVDFTKPENFARYGSAEEYYVSAIQRLYTTYPYDGSLKERLEWQNKSSYLDLYVYNNLYPRRNGYIIFSQDGWGTQQSSTDGYGSSSLPEYIYIPGGPNTNPHGMDPFSVQFTGSNYYEVSMNRQSNLQLDMATDGASVEFWMKKDAFDTTKTEKEVIFDLWNGKDRTQATAVDAIDTTGVVADGGDCTITITIPAANGGDTTGGPGAITILLDASETTGTPAAANQIGIGILGESDSSTATLIKRAINNTSNSRIIPASAGSRGTAGVSGITATEGSSNTQITLTMDTAGTEGNITGALASVSGVNIIDVEDFTGGANPGDYARMRVELTGAGVAETGADPFRLTMYSGTVGFRTASVCSTNITTASIADGKWHHYAFTVKSASAGIRTRFYMDGQLDKETNLGTVGINDVDFYGMRAHIGALITSPSGAAALSGSGKLSASLDEFRYWKKERTGEQIGRFWFTQVGGGVNTDPQPFIETKEVANVDLGVYYKFNEGITGVTATDKSVLDYSGRFSNGTWTGYTAGARNTGSAIVLSDAAISEFKDPIIYSFHPKVNELLGAMRSSGSAYDVNNNAAIYNTIPMWVVEEDSDGSGDIKKLTQILSSYFDTLHMQIQHLNKLKDINYISGSDKPLPFSEKLLTSYGFVAPELFLDADILEKLGDRSEDRVYEKSLEETKNIIYQNIYNNLNYIYKSKGTDKAFRNLIRCFGIDDELVKINMYGDGIEYTLDNNRRNVIVTDKFVDFNSAENKFGSVFNYQDSSNADSVGFITSSTDLSGGHSFTLETELLMPLKPLDSAAAYFDTDVISSSLFGVHGVREIAGLNDTQWPSGKMSDAVNFQVYAVRDEIHSTNARFVLTGSAGGYVPSLKSALFEDLYSNTRWNLSVRVRPENYPLAGFASASNNGNFVVELHGIQAEAGEILQEFTLTGSVTNPTGSFITGSKRVYIGAHATDFTSSILATSDAKVNACRYWLDYIEDEALKGHILDTENHGTLLANQYAYTFNPSASSGDITKLDTLVFNWEFLNNTGSDTSGQFTVDDISSGSAAFTRFGALGSILNKQYTGLAYNFALSSTTPIDKDHVVSTKLNLPENIQSTDMVKVLTAQEQDIFTSDSRPVHYYFAFEKSMYQVISEEIINYFANLKDFHDLIGAPVNMYRPEYKSMKFLRQRFFEKVANEQLDFEKFYEFYKWFDSSLSTMLNQLVPASADFSENIRTMIEDHALTRSKNRRVFPFLERKGATDITASVEGGGDANAQFASEDPPGAGFFSNTAFTKRQIGSSNTLQVNPWKHIHAPIHPGEPELPFDNKYIEFNSKDWGTGPTPAYELAQSGSYMSASVFTVGAWLKFNNAFSDGHRTWFQFSDEGHKWGQIRSTGEIRYSQGFTGVNGDWDTTTAGLATDKWYHIAITYDGRKISNQPTIYVNGLSQSTNTTTSPIGVMTSGSDPPGIASAMIGSNCNMSGLGPNYSFRSSSISEMSFWDEILDADEVFEIYDRTNENTTNSCGEALVTYLSGAQDLMTHSASGSLVHWWRFGDLAADNINTIYDAANGAIAGVSGLSGTANYQIETDELAELLEHQGPLAVSGSIRGGTVTYDYNHNKDNNIYWWRYEAEREDAPLNMAHTGCAPTTLVTDRDMLLRAIRGSYNRRVGSPAKFSVEGAVTFGGVARHQSNHPNYVFRQVASEPGESGSLNNILVTKYEDVEKLLSSSTDVYYPSLKQRLGFGMNPDINTLDYSGSARKLDGNVYAPFSMYSSSVSVSGGSEQGPFGYARKISSSFSPGIDITNLHHDYVDSHDIPMQSPFTQKFVGGRQYRHIPLNQNYFRDKSALDTELTRPEAFRVQFAGVASNAGGNFSSSVAIIPANSSGSATTRNFPTAVRFRDETAKRPVNIKNILMTTASLSQRLTGALYHSDIGNYQKSYQVVQTCGRTTNDPYFQDQSMTFSTASCIPFIRRKTTDTRGFTGARWPLSLLQDKIVTDTSLHFSGAADTGTTTITEACPAVVVPYQWNLDTGGQMTAGSNVGIGSGSVGFTFSCWYSASAIEVNEGGSPVYSPNVRRPFFTQGSNTFWSQNINGRCPIRSFDWSTYQNKLRFATLATTNTGADVAVTGLYEVYSSLQLMTGSHLEGWHHVALTFGHGSKQDSGNWTTYMYIDGSQYTVAYGNAAGGYVYPIASSSVPTVAASGTSGDLVIKAHCNDDSYASNTVPYRNGVNGYMDEVMWFSEPLSANGIRSLYNAGCPGDPYGPGASGVTPLSEYFRTSLVGWWGMGEGLTSTNLTSPGAVLSRTTSQLSNSAPNNAQLTGAAGTDPLDTTVLSSKIPTGCTPLPDSRYLDFLLADRLDRLGRSNKNIIVNRFSSPGSFEVSSRGYMTQPHEEMSPYNAAPYRNRGVINYGMSGSASTDPITALTISPRDQIDKPRGLNELATLHCGEFGYDYAYGSVPTDTYVTVPSYQKTNRNRVRRMVSGSGAIPADQLGLYFTGSQYDNLFVQHAIPRSTQQYSWVTASLGQGETIFGLQRATCTSASWLDQLMTSSGYSVGYPFTSGSASVHYAEDGRGVMVPFSNTNLVGPVGAQAINLKTHTLMRPQGAFNRRSMYVSGSLPGNPDDADEQHAKSMNMFIGVKGVWNLIYGLSDRDTKFQPMSISMWINTFPKATMEDGEAAYLVSMGTSRTIAVKQIPEGVTHKAGVYEIEWRVDDGIYKTNLELKENTWYHVVCAINGGNPRTYKNNGTSSAMRIYVNGIENTGIQAVLATIAPLAGGSCYIGQYGGANQGQNFHGLIDEVRFWKASINHEQANLLYNHGCPIDPGVVKQMPTGSLVGWYRMGDLGDRYAPDSQGLPSGAVIFNHALQPGYDTTAYAAVTGAYNHELLYSLTKGVIGLGATASLNPAEYCAITGNVPPPLYNYSFNSMNLMRNGPYGYSSWQQMRTGDHPVARQLRKYNLIGSTLAPTTIEVDGQIAGPPGKRPNKFVDYYEAPINSSNIPVRFWFEDNTQDIDKDNNIQVVVPYGNQVDYFSHNGLNNLLNLNIDTTRRRAYNSVLDYAVQSNLSLVASHGQRVYPSDKVAYKGDIRGRKIYSIDRIWNDSRAKRTSITLGNVDDQKDIGGSGPDEAIIGPNPPSSAMGYRVLSQSIWPLDGHNGHYQQRTSGTILSSVDQYFSITSSTVLNPDAAGILMNSYSLYETSNSTAQHAAPTYATRIFMGYARGEGWLNPNNPAVLAGDVEFQAAAQFSGSPYQDYKPYAQHIREKGKDHSILPEFRLEDHLSTYLNELEENYLADIDNLFSLTGSELSSSTDPGFFQTYTNADFLKYFKVIDTDLYQKRSGDLQIVRDKIILKCDALLKFLPYKGFYPAERCVELASLFSQSYGPSLSQDDTQLSAPFTKLFRVVMDPLFSPGILFNTIKAGIGLSNFVITNTASAATGSYTPGFRMRTPDEEDQSNLKDNGGVDWEEGRIGLANAFIVESPLGLTGAGTPKNHIDQGYHRGYQAHKVPFEALYRPEDFFNDGNILSLSSSWGNPEDTNDGASMTGAMPRLYDVNPTQSIILNKQAPGGTYVKWPDVTTFLTPTDYLNARGDSFQVDSNAFIDFSGNPLQGKKDYRLAMDNFLCETTNMFVEDFVNFRSAREEDFGRTVAGKVYTMSLIMYRTLDSSGSIGRPDRKAFTMYNRNTAFGIPMWEVSLQKPTYCHVEPPYYNSAKEVKFTYTASVGGQPSLATIFESLELNEYDLLKENTTTGTRIPTSTGSALRIKVEDCVDLTEMVTDAPTAATPRSYWVMQSKFETPVLNFAKVSASVPPPSVWPFYYNGVNGALTAERLRIKGMWHQKGQPLTSSDEGIFMTLRTPTDSTAGEESLAKLCGFEVGVEKRIGRINNSFLLEEAVVAVPFKIVDNKREFFEIPRELWSSQTYTALQAAMGKYVFPPKLDFTRNIVPGTVQSAVNPVIMYVFEFSAKLDRDDIANIWQNLPPKLATDFKQKEAVVHDEELIDLIANNSQDVQWMVFKVKKRAVKNFERLRRSMVAENLVGFDHFDVGEYSYNWPYDFFSLVELAKISETVQYKSSDLIRNIDTSEAGGGTAQGGASSGGVSTPPSAGGGLGISAGPVAPTPTPLSPINLDTPVTSTPTTSMSLSPIPFPLSFPSPSAPPSARTPRNLPGPPQMQRALPSVPTPTPSVNTSRVSLSTLYFPF